MTSVWGQALPYYSPVFVGSRKTYRFGREKLSRLTGEHGEDGGEGVEFEPVDDVAGVEELETHEAEADHQQQDVKHLGHHRQPQNTCRNDTVILITNNCLH